MMTLAVHRGAQPWSKDDCMRGENDENNRRRGYYSGE